MVRQIKLLLFLGLMFTLVIGSVNATGVSLEAPTTSENITSSTYTFNVLWENASDPGFLDTTADMNIWYDNSGTLTSLCSNTSLSIEFNTSSWFVFNTSCTVSGVSDGAYTFWAEIFNATYSANSSNVTVVGIDDTGPSTPSCTFTYARLYLGDRQSITCTSTDTAFTSDSVSMTVTSTTDSISSASATCSGTNPTTCTYAFPNPIRHASTHSVSITATDQHSQTTTGTTTFLAVDDGGAGPRLAGVTQEIQIQDNTATMVILFAVVVSVMGFYMFFMRK